MKKRIFLLFLTVGMIAAGCGNKEASEAPEIQISDETEIDETAIPDEKEEVEDGTEVKDVTETAEETLSFSEFEDLEFYFASGAGGWRTVMQIENDGSFLGQFSDGDMGSAGEGYPKGTVYLSEFEGKFTQPVKVNDYTYSMEIEEINYGEKFGTEEVIDGVLYCYGDAYGLAGAEEILIYLPGAPTSELPEEYMSWVRNDMEDSDALELPFYGLYNVKEQNGFSSYDISDRIADMMAATEEWALTVRASLENDVLTQADMNMKAMELYEIWDSALNTLWEELKDQLPEEEFAELLDEQRTWIAEKEQSMLDAGKEVEGGSVYSLVVNMKAAEITEARVYELYELLK